MRPRDHRRRATRSPASAATATTCSATASSARRVDAQAAPRGPRPRPHAADQARRRVRQPATWDEAFAEIERRLSADRRAARPPVARPRTSATRARTTCRRCCTAGRSSRRSARRTSSRPAPSTSGRRRCRRRSCSAGSTVPVPDVDRTDFLLDARRQSVRVERQPGDRARLARAHRGDARPRRQARGRRPTPQPDRRGSRRVDRDPPRHRPVPARGDGPHALVDEGLVDLGTVAEYVNGLRRRWSPRWRPYDADAVAGVTGVDADDDPAPRARARRRADGRGLRPHRHDHRRVRHASRAGSSTSSTSCPATSIVRAARCSRRRPPGGSNTRGKPRAGRDLRLGARTSRVRGLGATLGELPAVVPRRGDRDARRRPDPGDVHDRRQPGAVDSRTAARLDAALERSSLWCRSTSTSTRRRGTPT